MRAVAFVVALFCACGFGAKLPASETDAAMTDAPIAPDCFAARCRRKTIEIDPAKVTGGPHAQFPLLVVLADPDFAMATGPDFVFTAADGTTALPYERERFANDELIAWVAVPMLSSTEPTILHLYYGDATATDSAMPAAVWDASTIATWHLAQTTGGAAAILDSTANANHGTNENNPTLGVDGKIGYATSFVGTATQRLRIPQDTTLAEAAGTATVSLWVKWVAAVGTTYQRMWMSADTFVGADNGMEWATNAEGFYYYYPADAGGTNYVAIATPFTNGQWHHVALTQDFATKTVLMYVDGAERMKLADNMATSWTRLVANGDWYWGGPPPQTTNSFAGALDEIRVSKVVRSAGWIATEYANQDSPSTFYSVR